MKSLLQTIHILVNEINFKSTLNFVCRCSVHFTALLIKRYCWNQITREPNHLHKPLRRYLLCNVTKLPHCVTIEYYYVWRSTYYVIPVWLYKKNALALGSVNRNSRKLCQKLNTENRSVFVRDGINLTLLL